MKKILLLLLFLSFPYTSFAQLDVYLSTQNLPYGKDVWTSANSPHTWSSKIQIERYFHREEYPQDYQKTLQEIKAITDSLFPSLTALEKQARYNSLMAFDKQNFSQYIAIAISSDTESDISDIQASPFLLTPFESTFQACGISLNTRRAVARDLIEGIHSGTYANIDALQYTNIRFWDCVIPFPDTRRVSSIGDSFPSNKIIAQSLWWTPLDFWTLEDSVDLFSLSDVDITWSYQWVQAADLLGLVSTRIEQDTSFDKEAGSGETLFVHQNHYINPFFDDRINGNTTPYNTSQWLYNASHPLVIRSTDTDVERTLSPWQEIQAWFYKKTVIQEDTFNLVAGVYIPKQHVRATTYYAIVYNYDTTGPQCPTTLFSHENTGIENFIFPEYPWFWKSKYWYFVCSDEESGCSCDSSDVGCFLRDDTILSIPQKIPHSGTFQYRFWNAAGLSTVCNSPTEQELFYDKTSPDMRIILPGIPEASLLREYVNNAGVLYDGEEITEKRFYHIKNDINFQADSSLDIKLQLYDLYDNTKVEEWVSWLNSYNLRIAELENGNWVNKIEQDHIFPEYNPLGTLWVQDLHPLDFQTLDNIEDIITKIGKYQVYVDFDDAAGNQSRVVFYFNIISADIDVGKSILEVWARDTLYADNSSSYSYTLALKDKYFNPVAWKSIVDIEQSCVSVSDCSELLLDMTWAAPIPVQALDIYDIDSVSDTQWLVHFSVQSRVPGVFTESFMVSVLNPNISLRFSSWDNTFLAPFVGVLESSVWWQWVSDVLPINQISNYRVRIEDSQSLWYTWTLSNFSAHLHGKHLDTDFINPSVPTPWVGGIYFSGNFTSSLSEDEKHKTLLEIIDTPISGVEISYDLAGETVKYYLSSSSLSQEILQLGNTGELQNPVKIIWNFQWVGNTHNASERQNITDVDIYNLRTTLRKNVGVHISKRIDDTLISGVKYIDKTLDSNKAYVLESNPSFETLVVRNGNILIEDDFNASWKVVGLISYIDTGYNKENGFDAIGNIYVEPEVISINALMYADGWLITTQSWNPISWSIPVRNDILEKQLSITGSLFTRNTLAGWRQLSGEYMLPGWTTTINQSLAVQYDLYYMRRGNEECIRDTYGFCDIPAYLIIEYDPRVSSSPPKFFEMK